MEKAIEDAIDWNRILTKDGETQKSERYYISVIIEQFEKLGAKVGSNAATQQAIDIRDVEWPDGTVASYEGKKVNKGSRFIFNDTFIKPDVWYIFIYGHLKKVRVAKGSTLIDESSNVYETNQPKRNLRKIGELVLDMLTDEITNTLVKDFFVEVLAFLKACVIYKVLSHFEFGELFKKSIVFGNFTSRPRPNWSLTIPYKPSQSKEVEQHCPAEQPGLSSIQTDSNLVEIPVSPSVHPPSNTEDTSDLPPREPRTIWVDDRTYK